MNKQHILSVVSALALAVTAFSGPTFAREAESGDDRGGVKAAYSAGIDVLVGRGQDDPAEVETQMVGRGKDDTHPEVELLGRGKDDTHPEIELLGRGGDDTHPELLGRGADDTHPEVEPLG
jgi:hypothetical protein